MAGTVTLLKYLSTAQVSEMTGMSETFLRQLRFHGTGPRYFKPTPQKVLYLAADVEEWITASARTGTADPQ